MLFRLKTLLLSQLHIRFSSWNPSSPVQEQIRPKFVQPLPLPLFDPSKPFIICVEHRTIKPSWLEPVTELKPTFWQNWDKTSHGRLPYVNMTGRTCNTRSALLSYGAGPPSVLFSKIFNQVSIRNYSNCIISMKCTYHNTLTTSIMKKYYYLDHCSMFNLQWCLFFFNIG